jgi:hypothetical protein
LKYFEEISDQIKKEFKLKDFVEDKALEYLSAFEDKEVVSVHVRRGDTCDGVSGFDAQNYFGTLDNPDRNLSPYQQYLKSAMDRFDDNYVFLIFTGGSRDPKVGNTKDVEWCKVNIKGPNIHYAESNSDILDFAIMKNCSHNIMCGASSFGWWAAYLNDNSSKKIIAPKEYLLGIEKNKSYIYLPEWNII